MHNYKLGQPRPCSKSGTQKISELNVHSNPSHCMFRTEKATDREVQDDDRFWKSFSKQRD